MEPMIIVSADAHAAALPATYRDYIDPEFREALAELEEEGRFFAMAGNLGGIRPEQMEAVDDEGALAGGGVDGGWDMDRRLREMDREGVAAEIVLAGTQTTTLPFFATINKPRPPAMRAAGARAYHRWLSDGVAASNGRLYGVGDAGPCVDMGETVGELRWMADHGFVGVNLPGYAGDPALPPLSDPYFEPFWATCAETGLRLIVHAGFGLAQGSYFEMFERAAQIMMKPLEEQENIFDDPFFSTLDTRYRRAIWQLLLSGAFGRHPSLKLIPTELGASWIPSLFAFFDSVFEAGRTPLKRRPSDYWRDNMMVTASSIHLAEVDMREEIGVDHLMFGTDYPHPESTWPNTKDWIRAAFKGVGEADARRILGENAIACYGLDRARLAAVAARIGPKPADLFGDHAIDPRKIESFAERGGFSRPADPVDAGKLAPMVAEEAARLVAAE